MLVQVQMILVPLHRMQGDPLDLGLFLGPICVAVCFLGRFGSSKFRRGPTVDLDFELLFLVWPFFVCQK